MSDTRKFNEKDLVSNKEKLTKLIVDVISSLEQDGMPKVKNISTDIRIKNSNYQTQSQTQSQHQFIDIVSKAITDELTVDEIHHLRELVKKGESKGNILKTIINFGKDTSSKILANLITNEKFWTFLDTIPKG